MIEIASLLNPIPLREGFGCVWRCYLHRTGDLVSQTAPRSSRVRPMPCDKHTRLYLSELVTEMLGYLQPARGKSELARHRPTNYPHERRDGQWLQLNCSHLKHIEAQDTRKECRKATMAAGMGNVSSIKEHCERVATAPFLLQLPLHSSQANATNTELVFCIYGIWSAP